MNESEMDEFTKKRVIRTLAEEGATTVERLVDEQVRKMLNNGHPIRNLDAFKADWRGRIVQHAHEDIHFLERARIRLDGGKITQCREVRGTHGITHIYDPAGTDTPPPWWNRDEAKRLANA